jgi:two-component system sensor histidine kinase DegS
MKHDSITALSELLENMILQKKYLESDTEESDDYLERNLFSTDEDSNENEKKRLLAEEFDTDIQRLTNVIKFEHEKKKHKETHREALTILQIQEDERRRVAMELHDVSLQNLAYLIHKIELCARYVDSDPNKAKEELGSVGISIRKIIDEMRNIIFNLRPVDFGDRGMRSDLEHLTYKLNEQNTFFVSTDIDDVDFHDNITQVSVYRIVKECLTNAFKHSQGNQLFFSMKLEGDVCAIKIKDNGIGFNPETIKETKRNHFGISVMQERVRLLDGILNIETEMGIGTTITIYIPCSGKS